MQTVTTIKDVIKETTAKMDKCIDAAKREFQNLRTGRASIHLVEGVLVNYYGTPTPIKNLGTVATPDAKTIVIQPWDVNAVNEIDRALQASDLGIMPENDGKIIRLRIPPLTEERRNDLVKLIKKVAEEGRVSIRNARHEGNEAVKKLEKTKLATEDDVEKTLKEIQKLTDDHIKKIDELLLKKEQEIKEI